MYPVPLSNLQRALPYVVYPLSGVVAAATMLFACPPAPSPSPMPPDAFEVGPPIPLPEASTYDGSTTSDCYLACEALKTAGCREGSGACVLKLQTIQDLHTEQNLANGKRPLTCVDVEKVKTPADFRAMGQVCTVGDGG